MGTAACSSAMRGISISSRACVVCSALRPDSSRRMLQVRASQTATICASRRSRCALPTAPGGESTANALRHQETWYSRPRFASSTIPSTRSASA
ncbi:hypothetical protein EDM22_01545 [Agromyces tardus]|uniref:Uncharacterized protein n=1 Tax=Agromyces tardus TaxID=2583849 RepID=A0A3M8AMI3_9MICO|nr:hypothetical protein EDM22_01545 [Agromyces tardus]